MNTEGEKSMNTLSKNFLQPGLIKMVRLEVGVKGRGRDTTSKRPVYNFESSGKGK